MADSPRLSRDSTAFRDERGQEGGLILGAGAITPLHPIKPDFFTLPASVRGVDSRNVGPTFFLLVSAKKVRQHKRSESTGLCLENSIKTGKMALFLPSKKRHFPPFFEDSFRFVGPPSSHPTQPRTRPWPAAPAPYRLRGPFWYHRLYRRRARFTDRGAVGHA